MSLRYLYCRGSIMTELTQFKDFIDTTYGVGTFDIIDLGNPYASDEKKNTSITLTAKPDSEYRGSRTIYYDRIPLKQAIYVCNKPQIDIPKANFLSEVMSIINQVLSTDIEVGISIPDLDLVAAGINNDQYTLVRLVALPSSLIYIGYVEIYLKSYEVA